LGFAYDGLQCIAEMNATNNTVLRSYAWGTDLSGTQTGAGGVGGLLIMNDVQNGTHFYGYDGNGNVSALVSASNGEVTANYEYGPFGEPIRVSGIMSKENPYRFSTKRTVDSIDIILYEYRAYSPSLGRWLSRDPIGEKGGKNLYVFLGNCPAMRIDILGLIEYNFDNNTYYREIEFQPGDVWILNGVRHTVKKKNPPELRPLICLLNKLGLKVQNPKFSIYFADFNDQGTAWTLSYGIPTKRPTFFDESRIVPITTVNIDFIVVTYWHEVVGHNINGEDDGTAFDIKYEKPVIDMIAASKKHYECMWCEPSNGGRRWVVNNQYLRFLCECGINPPNTWKK